LCLTPPARLSFIESPENAFDRSIDTQILRLRRKLERDPGACHVIQTERGVEYVVAVPVGRARLSRTLASAAAFRRAGLIGANAWR
jgi:hypothetical protein